MLEDVIFRRILKNYCLLEGMWCGELILTLHASKKNCIIYLHEPKVLLM